MSKNKKKNIVKKISGLFSKSSLITYVTVCSIIFDYIYYSSKIVGLDSNHDIPIIYLILNILAYVVSFAFINIKMDRIYFYPIIALPFASVGILYSFFVKISIIAIVWHSVFGVFVSICYFVLDYLFDLKKCIKHELDNNSHREIIQNLKNEFWSFIKIIIQFVLSFTAILGVCMSILFGINVSFMDANKSASRMVVGYFICISIFYIWIFPVFNKTVKYLRKNGY